MKHMLTNLCLLAGIFFGTSAFAQTVTFDGATRYLTIPSIQVGTTIYSNVVVRLDSFAIISVGSGTSVSSSVADTCVAANLTIAKFNAVAIGMTPDQVNQTIGCKFDASNITRSSTSVAYGWSAYQGSFKIITVVFDLAGTNGTSTVGGAFYKSSSGL